MALLGIGDETPISRTPSSQLDDAGQRKPGKDSYKDIIAASNFLEDRLGHLCHASVEYSGLERGLASTQNASPRMLVPSHKRHSKPWGCSWQAIASPHADVLSDA